MSEHNGNGERPSTPLQNIEQRIVNRTASEREMYAVRPTDPAPGMDDDMPPSTDPLTSWKDRGEPITLERVHAGLIATCEYAEAAIEGGIKMAADVHEIVKSVELRTQQIALLTTKVEINSKHTHKVDDELATQHKVLNEVRRDVQTLKDDMREVKEAVQSVPALKEMLGEILARLPETKK
jgi:hypothetical protein